MKAVLISPCCFCLLCDPVALFCFCVHLTWEIRYSLDLVFLAQCLTYRKTSKASVCLLNLNKALLMPHCYSKADLQQQYVIQTRAAHGSLWNQWAPTKARYLLSEKTSYSLLLIFFMSYVWRQVERATIHVILTHLTNTEHLLWARPCLRHLRYNMRMIKSSQHLDKDWDIWTFNLNDIMVMTWVLREVQGAVKFLT